MSGQQQEATETGVQPAVDAGGEADVAGGSTRGKRRASFAEDLFGSTLAAGPVEASPPSRGTSEPKHITRPQRLFLDDGHRSRSVSQEPLTPGTTSDFAAILDMIHVDGNPDGMEAALYAMISRQVLRPSPVNSGCCVEAFFFSCARRRVVRRCADTKLRSLT